MPLFLITFLSLYGSLHVYAYIRLRSIFPASTTALTFLACLMSLMAVSPLLVRMAEGAEFARTASILAWPAYIWMGCIFILCIFLATLDVIRTLAWLMHRYSGTAVPGFLSAASTGEIALLLAMITSGYALYEARKVRTEQVTIPTSKLAPESGRLRIVQISDVHIGILYRESRLGELLKVVRNANPDILVSTGDLVDGRLSREDVASRLDRMAAMIAAVPTRAGKFAVAGNHEFYAGIGPSLAFTRAAGFTVLRNQSSQLPEGITISGIDDPAGQRHDAAPTSVSEALLVHSLQKNRFHVLLKHRPVVAASSDGLTDLQLSGHVHKGQLFPFNLLVRLKFPIPCGTSSTAAGSLIHVSRGSGTWGPPMRFLAPPEVTIIDLISAPGQPRSSAEEITK